MTTEQHPAPSGPVARLAGRAARPPLRVLLAVLGRALAAASLVHPGVRRQITRSLCVEISTGDGVVRQFAFDARARRMATTPTRTMPADHALRFATSAHTLRALASPDAVDRIIRAASRGTARVEGSAFIVLWFHGLTRLVAPIGPTPGPRDLVPGAYVRPDPATHGDEKIVIEPAVDRLDPRWTAAWNARATLWQVRAPAGEPVPEP